MFANANANDNNKRPKLVILKNEEKFRVNKKVVEIEARGKRTLEGILFRFSDLNKHFNLDDIKTKNDQMFNVGTKGQFEKDRHFKYYKNEKNENKYYLTYNGVIHMMGSCESKHARNFEKWATKIVYTVQMGSKEEKEELASQLLGTPLKEIKERITDKIDERLTFLYILSLGKVQKFRNEIKEPSEDMKDNHIVFKHGYTGNIAKQASQIQYKYGSESADLQIVKFAIIDKSNIRQAKSDFLKKVKEIADGKRKLNYGKHIDIFSAEKSGLDELRDCLDKIGKKYGPSDQEKAFRRDTKKMKKKMKKMKKKMEEKETEFKEKLDEKDDEIKRLNRKLMFEELKKKVAIRTARLNDQLHTQHANVLMQIIRTQKILLDMNNN